MRCPLLVLLSMFLLLLLPTMTSSYKPACEVIEMMESNVVTLRRSLRKLEIQQKAAAKVLKATTDRVMAKRRAIENQKLAIKNQKIAIHVSTGGRTRRRSGRSRIGCD